MKLYRCALFALFVPSIASAHISLKNGPLLAKTSGQKVTFGINHGCEVDENTHLDTLSIKVDIPAGIDGASVRAMASELDRSPAVAKTDGKVTSVTWERDPADLQDGDVAYYELTLRVKLDDVPFTKIPFVITQVCRPKGGTPADDITVVWTGPDTNPEPSPVLYVVQGHSTGWNKLTLAADVTSADLGFYFVDETTAAGPAAVNDGMPQSGPFPTLEERRQLGEWIACDMPSDGSQD